jgi:aspartate/methionine/tyrosine aminotransferase
MEMQNKLLNEAGVAIMSGTSFGAQGEGYVRFSYANSTDNILKAVARIRDCLSG